MSEDFDKEAERKRLREKYEADREDREATERMSELLLQGATMTNKHCDTCGSPIFRYQGQEFCPTCGEERGGGTADQGPESAAAGDQGPETAQEDQQAGDSHAAGDPENADAGTAGGHKQAAGGTGAQEAARDAPEHVGGQPTTRSAPTGRSQGGQAGAGQSEGGQAGTGQSEGGQAGTGQSEGGQAGTRRSDSGRPVTGQSGPGQPGTGQPAPVGSINEARASLVRTITTYAKRAEAADDPRKARELLGAAKEAAETLARLDGD